MQTYQREFIDFCIQFNVLKFGHFTLKSGRQSPYFFNAGLFNTGSALLKLGQFYSAAINDAHIAYDMLFGPAYKGIPLVCTTAMGLAQHFQKDIPYSFNRKEKKEHGETGQIVGHALSGKVLIVDDVMTAGTAIRESIPLIQEMGATPAGIIIMLDRQERGQGRLSAIQEIQKEFNIPVVSIIQLDHLMEYLQKESTMKDTLNNIVNYREIYGTEE